MTTPDEVVRATLAEQAAAVTAPAAPLNVPDAAPAAVDLSELLARIKELEAVREQAARDAEPPPPDNSLQLDGNAPSYLRAIVDKIEARLQAAGL